LETLLGSPFTFYRGTFHLFANDVKDGPFRKWSGVDARGPIIGDLHTENFGAYRAVTNEIVYDVNDFDETTSELYDLDLRRLAASLLLSSVDLKHSLGDGVNAAEQMARAYLDALGRHGKLQRRKDFAELPETGQIRRLLHSAAEKSRVEYLKTLAAER